MENPQFSVASGDYNKTQNVTISSPTKGVEIRYTTDGSTPDKKSKLYVSAIKISKDTTIKAVAYRKGMITPVYQQPHIKLAVEVRKNRTRE